MYLHSRLYSERTRRLYRTVGLARTLTRGRRAARRDGGRTGWGAKWTDERRCISALVDAVDNGIAL